MKTLLLLLGITGSAWFLVDAAPWAPSAGAGDTHVTYHGNGRRKASVGYREGLPDGPAREWYPDGSLASEGRFEDGRREGNWSFWSEDGTLDAERSGLYVDGRRRDTSG